MNDSNRLDNFLKRKLKGFEKTPSENNWEKIQTELSKRRRTPWIQGIALCLILFLIGSNIYWLFSNKEKQNRFVTINNISPKQDMALINQSKPTKSIPLKDNHTDKKVYANNFNNRLPQMNYVSNSLTEESGNDDDIQNAELSMSEQQEKITPILPLLSYLSNTNESTPEFVNDDYINLEKYIIKDEIRNEIHIGMKYVFNNAWILNQNTYGGFYGSELNYKINDGYDYGVVIGYDIKKKYGIQAEWDIKSLQGQKYEDVIRRKHFVRTVSLEYTNIPVLFKYKKQFHVKQIPVSVNYLGGMRYSNLRSASITVNDLTSSAEERFQKNIYAAVLGVESNIYLSKTLYFTLGVRSSISSDINSSDYPVVKERSGLFGDYTKSHSFLLGVNASLNYCFER